jgi:predicted nucleic acid-binding protein
MLTLRGCEIVPFEEDDVSPVGKLLARSGTSDVVDGLVALTAAKAIAAVVTSDPDDITHLLGTLGVRLAVLEP